MLGSVDGNVDGNVHNSCALSGLAIVIQAPANSLVFGGKRASVALGSRSGGLRKYQLLW